MPECCEEERTSSYCPDCGKHLHGDASLRALVVFCRRHARAAVKAIEELKKDFPDRTSLLKFAEKRLAKWKSWADQIEALIK